MVFEQTLQRARDLNLSVSTLPEKTVGRLTILKICCRCGKARSGSCFRSRFEWENSPSSFQRSTKKRIYYQPSKPLGYLTTIWK